MSLEPTLRVPQAEPPPSAEQLAARPEARPKPLLIDLAEIAALASVSRATAERWKAARRLPAHIELSRGLHRWRRQDIERLIELGCPSRREFEARTGRGRA